MNECTLEYAQGAEEGDMKQEHNSAVLLDFLTCGTLESAR